MKKLASLSIILFLLIGGLGLRTIADCDSDLQIDTDSKLMSCYYSAAMTSAYMGNIAEARATCYEIFSKFGSSEDMQTGSDIRKKADLMKNNCYYEVAKILARTDVDQAAYTCDLIATQDDFGSELVGDAVTNEACHDEVTRLALVTPDNYYQNPDNICAIVFVLPLILLGSLKIRVRP
ncbi:MAG: hypothetical protein PHF60_03335 [Candidatus ainarchaeum sp.]|nr:hypothetical protein [Candidatus ainarchaeum sp.]